MTATKARKRPTPLGPRSRRNTRKPDLASLERRLGLPLGPLLRSLIEAAYAAPAALGKADPATAFEFVDMRLPWIAPDGPDPSELVVPGLTPLGCVPFATTAHEFPQACLWVRAGAPSSDDVPIVIAAPEVPAARVFAPDLAAFLSVVAYAGFPWRSADRDLDDEAWDARRVAVMEDETWGPKAERAAERLLNLPGVSLPDSPRALIHMTREEEPSFETHPGAPDPLRLLRPDHALAQAKAAIAAGRFEAAERYAKRAMQAAEHAELTTLLGAEAMGRAGRGAEAADEVERLAREWVHRATVHFALLDRLLELDAQLGGPMAPALRGEVLRTRQAAWDAGDFL